ncbi:MAG: 2-phosphosulfolactate phosphatase [Phycisphaerales bacterium]|nr:2-phosphosulfolactate phosphatase [Phycisphaerales bacterium]
MKMEVALLPAELSRFDLSRHTVVVFDVLRATTTMTAALDAGVEEIRIFTDIDAARSAGDSFGADRLLCGEQNCLRPSGFDLGNSPGVWHAGHAGRTLFMATTNGTRALVGARGAAHLLVGAIVNASAVARQVANQGCDAILLCAGTNGRAAMEDLIGCGAVLSAMDRIGPMDCAGDESRIARWLYESNKHNLSAALGQSEGGRNVLAAGLGADIEFAARLDALTTVGRAIEAPDGLRIRKITSTD